MSRTLTQMSEQERAATLGKREQEEIEATYDRLGLGTPEARAEFARWSNPEPNRQSFQVVIATTTSNR